MKHARYLHNPLSRLLSLLLLMVFASATLTAQDECDNNCIGALDQPLNVTLNMTCDATILTSMVVPDLDACPGPKNLVVRDSLNRLLGQGVDAVPLEGDTLVGRRISVTITDQATGSVCVGYVRLHDNSSPTISECPEVTISCLEDASPTALGTPTVTDNCQATLTPTFIDNVILRDCLSDTAAVILRQWTADDGHGQTATCTQRINILRASAMSVSFPGDVVLSCDNPDVSPDSTGVPLLNNMPLMHGDLCGLEATYQDDTTFICQDYMFRVDRVWTVTESCTDFSETSTQVILVSDHTGPELTCPTPAQLVFSSDPGDCAATVTLPQPSAVDNCGSDISFQVTTSYGAAGFDPVSGVVPGTYQVNYFATDECGNPSSCSTTLTVVDDVQPTASCDDLVNVSLTSNGVAILSASAFDEGSSDNCASPVFVKARRATVGECSGMNGDDSNQFGFQEWFDDRVVFCCDDASADVQVTLRVYEVNPGSGPVDPNRETGDGDLAGHYTECTSMVHIQDGQGPRFSACPADITVQCTDELDDVTIYGSPNVIADNCGAALTVDSTVTRSLDECRQGNIVRRWIVSNPDNQRATCVQTITVENNEILPESAITWPLDYETTECGADLSLENLPLEYREPVVDWDGCGTVAMNMTESYFDRSAPACFKILRTWTIIDWCHYEQGADIPVGRYQHTQQLKVIDNVAPVISCPAPVEVNVSANCTTGPVVMDAPALEDCAGQVTVTHNSPYADNNGPLANGDYPVGTHTVRFLATDGCGLTTACTTTVTVRDMQPPSVSCNGGLTVSLMPMPEGGAGGSLPAIDFVASAIDNCDPTNLLKYSVRHADDNSIGVPTATEVFFDCGDLSAPQLVEVFVRDNNNNAASCTTLVAVQENNGACQGQSSAMGMIAGAVITENGVEVENVTIRVAGDSPTMQYTGIDGSFRFDDLPAGNDYTIMPEMNEDLLNGVTTMDIVLMSKHIIGTRPLSSPYKIIAADVDRSGHVSTLDIIRLRKLILRIDNAFPNNNTAWRFIDASYEFADPTNPFLGYFPEVYNVNDLGGEEMHADFIAIKVGDVNGSARANSFQAPGGRNLPQGLVLNVENQALGLDEVVEIPVRARYMNEWSGYQFTLEFNPSSLEVFEIVPGELPNLYAEENFNLFDLESGLITTIWHEFDEMADGREMTLFSLRCRAKQPVEIKDALYLSSRVTAAEAVSQEGETGEVSISFNSNFTETGTTFELYQNRPNPWTNSTIIPFELDPGGDASLTIYDMAGKQVYRTDGNYTSGYHEISVSRYDLPAVGLFYYTLESGDQRATRKMVLTD